MSDRQIVFSNDPILHQPSRRVRRVDEGLRRLIGDMFDAMQDADGVGLAAVQVGVPERVIVVEVPVFPEEEAGEIEEPLKTERYAVINPELVNASKQMEEGIEGCLSIPGWVGEVERHRAVTVEGLDQQGEKVRIEAEGLLARVFQHEVDHCGGVLFIDHIDDPEKIWPVEEDTQEEAAATGGVEA